MYLLSADFLTSDFWYNMALLKAIEKQETGDDVVIPVILRSCDWQNTPIRQLSPLSNNKVTVVSSKWHNIDEAFNNIAQGIRSAATQLQNPEIGKVDLR